MHNLVIMEKMISVPLKFYSHIPTEPTFVTINRPLTCSSLILSWPWPSKPATDFIGLAEDSLLIDYTKQILLPNKGDFISNV